MKKGFTLVEMLAVVVILGILATVAMMVTTNLLTKSEMGAFRDSGLGLINVAKEAYVDYAGQKFKVDLTDKDIYADGVKTGEKLIYNGLNPEIGIVNINSDGKVSMVLSDGVYCAYKLESSSDVEVFKISTSNKACDLSKLN